MVVVVGPLVAGPRMSRAEVIAYVTEQAPLRGVDPVAALAIAEQEGLGGEGASSVPGDNGTSFGPWQLHAGGELPSEVWAHGAQFSQAWAWSQQGVDSALIGLSGVSSGLQGAPAVVAISSQFERPCTTWNPQTGRCDASGTVNLVAKEVALATGNLGKWASTVAQGVGIPGVFVPGVTDIPAPPKPTDIPAPQPKSTQAAVPAGGLIGALQTLVAGTLGPNLANLGIKPDMSGLILLLASIFAILIGAILWRGNDVKATIKEAPKSAAMWVAAA